ncbi:BPTD_2524 family lipoprotein [Achromobacter denitrificans]
MYRNLVAASALALGLAGCSMGISQTGSSPHSEFKAPVAFKDAYATAIRQSNDCLRSTDNAYRVVADLNESAQSGVVQVLAPYSDNEMSRVELKAAGAKSTDVRIVMWGKGTWDAAAMRAMQDAVYYGLVSCSSYMPLDPRPKVKPSRDLPD